MMRKITIPPFLVFLVQMLIGSMTTHVQAQSVTATSGGQYANGAHSLSFTTGEAFISTLASGSYLLTQGFQQPWVFLGTGEPRIDVTAYPNPATDFVQVAANSPLPPNSVARLFDLNMAFIREDRLNGARTRIPLSGLPPGIYLLNISNNGETLKTIKVVKVVI